MPSHIRLYLRSLLLPLALLYTIVTAHQSISVPVPISRDVACRIDGVDHPYGRANCPGPCPSKHIRFDQTRNNPSVVVSRGSTLVAHTLANNHDGGFSRWSIVHERHMYDRDQHNQNAFLWTCADTARSKCDSRNHDRDCIYDDGDHFYKHEIEIPPIYEDGVYILGWAWYGGGSASAEFGDYYDCSYIRIQGGPYWPSYQPIFSPGPSLKGGNGRCMATVNQLGICKVEPCTHISGIASSTKPIEFLHGKKPKRLNAKSFRKPFRKKPFTLSSPRIKSLTVRNAKYPEIIYTSTLQTRHAHVKLKMSMGLTVTAEVKGRPRYVEFYTNGREPHREFHAPYTIAGDWRTNSKVYYAPWKYLVDNTVVTLSARVVGWDGTEDWANLELSTSF